MNTPRAQVVCLSALERPDVTLVAAALRAGAVGVLDLTSSRANARGALESLCELTTAPFAVRLSHDTPTSAFPLPAQCNLVIIPSSFAPMSDLREGRELFVEVRSLAEAQHAVDTIVPDGLMLSGSEAGGPVQETSAYVLLQEVSARFELPLWLRGGLGLRSAAAAVVGGASGVVFDVQLALLPESGLDSEVKRALKTMDGSDTKVESGRRFLARLDIAERALPIGEDGALAKVFAEHFTSVAEAVRGIERSLSSAPAIAKSCRPLAPGAGFAAMHGLTYPVVQGPMTRVSDNAEFAYAVASAGGLPTLALSLLSGERTRELLDSTQRTLGDLPWAVGILGFAPPDIRAAQLAVIEEVRPPVAIIAGGRPSQARPLEALGIATYLHVPSPGLLSFFLDEGARRFVFEGRECGGHVGPRSSFTLWELQIEILLRESSLQGVSVLFAGGIHDAASAAMVATLAAPLVERGVQVGIIMGTAYLFTEEAVQTGAIGAVYQEQAVICSETKLLETAPGHLTRCADSVYVSTFEERRLHLQHAGVPQEDAWLSLEQLNLGRLRIASKGIRREGEALNAVDLKTQRDEGLFMIGQVAAQREEVTTIEALHLSVTDDATQWLERFDAPNPKHSGAPVDIAIVGMSCIFPDADGLDAYWSNILAGHDSIREVPSERWNADIYWDPAGEAGKTTPSKWGGFIPDIPFDPLAYGMPPNSLKAIDPAQLLALEVAKRALDDAGYRDRAFDRSRTSVIFGAEAGTDLSAAYGFRALYPQYAGPVPEALDEALPRLTEDSFPGVLANVIAGRIANRLDLGGVNFTVDAACAASLAAVDAGVKELLSHSSDMVLCGAADLHNSINDYLMFSSVHALSKAGRCQPFSASADGIALGEGVACVVLKRLSDAQRDGDRVYAVIRGIAGASDGRSLGLTAPREDGQVNALSRAYERAGLSPREVGLVEAHGTGTVVGDRTELSSLERVWRLAGAQTGRCALGSVKSQIGHTKCAAGLAGLIKVALSLHHRVLPPTLHVETPNPAYAPEQSPFTLSTKARPWLHPQLQGAVSAFGFGGTNFHAVLEGVTPANNALASGHHWSAELLTFRGDSLKEAETFARTVLRFLEAHPETRLVDLAATLAQREGDVHFAMVSESIEEVITQLKAWESGSCERGYRAGERIGQVAFLFSGQGSQRTHMLADLTLALPRLQEKFRAHPELTACIFPATAFNPEEKERQRNALKDTRVAQPALGLVSSALHELLTDLGVRPDMVGGHSYGELVALHTAGAILDSDLLELSRLRGEFIVAAAGETPGTMAAVQAGGEQVRDLLRAISGVVIANENSPTQTVISGDRGAIDASVAVLKKAGVQAREIPVACAFHSPIVAGASESLRAHLDKLQVNSPNLPVWSNTTAGIYPRDPAAIRNQIASHLAAPVRFSAQIEAMHRAGARVFLEVGPGRVLTNLVQQSLEGREYRAIACDEPGPRGLRAFLSALGELIAAGVKVDPSALFEGRPYARIADFDRLEVPTPPAWLVNGHRARPLNGPVPEGGLQTVTQPIISPAPTAAAATPVAARETAVLEFLHNMKDQVLAQRDVMMAYLGASQVSAQPAMSWLPTTTPIVEAESTPMLVKPAEVATDSAAASTTPLETLLKIVSEKTGYPVAMLDPELDLEAELSIDSIKRIEIIGALGKALGWSSSMGSERDEMVEQLARIKTLNGIVAWLETRDPSDAGSSSSAAKTEAATTSENETATLRTEDTPHRYVRRLSALPSPPTTHTALSGRRIGMAGERLSLAERIAANLEEHGAEIVWVDQPAALARVETLLYLSPMKQDPTATDLKSLFDLSKAALDSGVKELIGVTRLSGPAQALTGGGSSTQSAGAGIPGLLKSLAKEWPEARVCCVDVDPTETENEVAAKLVSELHADDAQVEVAYADGQRQKVTYVPSEPPRSDVAPISLSSSSVILITGGARGITAHIARHVAERFGCHLVLVGRSPMPEPEDPRLRDDESLTQLRARLATLGELSSPREIETRARRIMHAREIRSTLADIEAAGATVEYRSLDVRDESKLESLIAELYARYDRLDGVIHGAGVIEDRLLRDKSRDSFERVVDTKAAGARVIARAIRDDIRFVVFFSSVSAAFGNRGQTDYAAANDILDKLATQMNERLSGRVVSIAWGPWASAGMVSEELEAEYRRRGVGLISPSDGVARFMDELARGEEAEPQVVWMCATPVEMAG